MDTNVNTLPDVSVVMSVYNSAPYLREAVDSILMQTLKNFEFIIINDGSTDESLSILKSYNDSRIILIDNGVNKGLIYSLNKGISVARGKYIARMDSDDISLAFRLEKQIQFLEANPQVGVCSCDYTQFNSTSEKSFSSFTNHDEIFSFLLFNSSVVHPTLMIRKTILDLNEKCFDENYKHAEDYELWSRLIFMCNFSSVSEQLFKYRLHEHQVTRIHNTLQQQSADKIRENILKKAGFQFNEEELRVHCALGSSKLITREEDLRLLGLWLSKLIIQNNQLQVIEKNIFIRSMHKQWFDACGNTNLGIRAYYMFDKIKFTSNYKVNKFKLLVKCLIRKFKSA